MKINVPTGTSLIAAPLNAQQEQLVAEFLREVPDQTEVVMLRDGLTITNTFRDLTGWDDSLMTVQPYEVLQVTTSEQFSLTLVGSFPNQPYPFARSIPAGESWSGLPMPSGLPWDRQLFPAVEGVTIWQLRPDGSRLQMAAFTGNEWQPAPPAIPNGTGFIIQSPQPLHWSVIYLQPDVIALNPGPANIRNLPERVVAAPDETVVLRPLVDGPRPMTVEWQHDVTGPLPLSAYFIRLPNSGDQSHGTFTLTVTDANGQTNSASIAVERHAGPPMIRPGSRAGKPAFELFGRTYQAHRLLLSHDLKSWTEWTPLGGPLSLPVWVDPENEFGDQLPVFLRLVAD